MQKTLRAFYELTKPRVTYGNVLTAMAGYFLAAAGNVQWEVFVGMTIGTTLVIASACATNNFLDQDIDRLMERTKKRPSVMGVLSSTQMVVFSAVLLALGLGVLWKWTNGLAVGLAVAGYGIYVWLYGALSKRQSIHGTLVGSISGAIPIIIGYAAARGVVDAGFVIAFLIMFFWQFPEFFSIAIYRRKEYKAAHIPVLPVVKGVEYTIRQIYFYTIAYVVSTLALTIIGSTGWIYFVVMLAIGARWIALAHKGLGMSVQQQDIWARQMFRFSMITILVLCVMLSVGPILP